MQILVSIITLSLIITPLVVLHELGHYLTAKYFKVRVLEFGLGFPPKIFSIWTQEIVYNLDNHVQINSHELEKAINRFSQLAKDAMSMGDIISQENYLQHVEHYSRRLAELRTQKSKETQEQSKSIETVSATTETK